MLLVKDELKLPVEQHCPYLKSERSLSYFKLLEQMVLCNSKTAHIEGVEKVLGLVEKELERLKFDILRIANPQGQQLSPHLLVGELKGETDEYITLVCHADTVFPEEGFKEITFKDINAYGPGIVDNKGGIIVALFGLEKLLSSFNKNRRYGLRFVCSPNEETGSTGFHKIFKKFSQDSAAILGFEPAFQGGDIITSRKGNRWYDVEVKGRKAHSGREHKLGLNACSELALQLASIQKLTDYSKDLTVNIGKIEGGQSHNIVSDYAFGQIEVRYPCHTTQHFITEKVEESLAKNYIECPEKKESTEISIKIVDDCPPMATNKSSIALFEQYQEVIQKIEQRKISPQSVGGAADVNHFSSPGKVILDGLGPIGGGMHTDNEFIRISSIDTRSDALKELILRIEEGALENEN